MGFFKRHLSSGVEESSVENTTTYQTLKIEFSENPRLGITFPLPGEITIENSTDLQVFSSSGRGVKILHNGPALPGNHTVTWNGRDELGRAVPEGVYLIRLSTSISSVTRRVIKLQ